MAESIRQLQGASAAGAAASSARFAARAFRRRCGFSFWTASRQRCWRRGDAYRRLRQRSLRRGASSLRNCRSCGLDGGEEGRRATGCCQRGRRCRRRWVVAGGAGPGVVEQRGLDAGVFGAPGQCGAVWPDQARQLLQAGKAEVAGEAARGGVERGRPGVSRWSMTRPSPGPEPFDDLAGHDDATGCLRCRPRDRLPVGNDGERTPARARGGFSGRRSRN